MMEKEMEFKQEDLVAARQFIRAYKFADMEAPLKTLGKKGEMEDGCTESQI